MRRGEAGSTLIERPNNDPVPDFHECQGKGYGDIFSRVLISAISANEINSQKLVLANNWPPSCLMYPDRHFAKNYTSKMAVKTQTNLPVKICHLKDIAKLCPRYKNSKLSFEVRFTPEVIPYQEHWKRVNKVES